MNEHNSLFILFLYFMMHTIINNHIFRTKIVNTPEKIQQGMMGATFDETFDSMLFVFPKKMEDPQAYDESNIYGDMQYESIAKERNKYHCFWMKNCIIPLDMIFIKNNIVQEVHHSCEPCLVENNCKNYCGFADYVLEVAGGTCKNYGIGIGNIVNFRK